MPVTSLLKFLFDDISNQKDLTSAKEIRDDKGCQGWYKNHRDPADDTRDTQRQNDFEKSLHIICTKISCSIKYIAVNFCKYIVNWQDHKWKKVVNHSKYDRSGSIDQRLLRQMKKMQYVIDDTVLFKQCLSCQCTEQEIHPHRENKDQYDKTRLIHILF